MNGTQSLVRLTLLERQRRVAQGKNTAVYVTGYRGSPLGSFDQALVSARELLGEHIVFQPGVNEDMAATAVWGTQQLGVFGEGRYEGVSSLWYGKGPGVDRTGDVFKHANLAGSAREGGVLVVAGDDHTCKSSTTAHQSEFGLIDAMIPVLAPASIREHLEYGLIGWELSRFSGLWVGMKVVTEIMDSNLSLTENPVLKLVTPDDFAFPYGGLSLQWPDTPLAQEERLHRFKIPAALAFSRANRLDRVMLDAPGATIGIVTVGKSYPDTRQALLDLGIDDTRAAALGIRLYKVAMPWPLEPSGIHAFVEGLTDIIIIEEKRSLLESQIREVLYGRANAPQIIGKRDKAGQWLFPSNGDLGADMIAIGLGRQIAELRRDSMISARVEALAEAVDRTRATLKLADRPPHFCPGCPHNTSTKVPEGSKAFAGIGCHYLILPMKRETEGFTHMGGEGANWIGLAPFSKTQHMFQNMGDGTYFHSGSLAVRAAIAAGVNMTYKILFNSAVAMTGGQPMDGDLTPSGVAKQMLAEGASMVVIVADDPSRYSAADRVDGVEVYERDELDAVQRQLREVSGVSILIYDQMCATELRRMRKRGKLPDPDVTIVINDLVCEGCGDCSVQSNCLAVTPVETEYGRKRQIDQSSCNKDQSCVSGFCPSFVTITGAKRRKPSLITTGGADLPEPELPSIKTPFPIIVTGIGGTGVVTIGAIIGMAAHMEGKAVRVMDMTGLAQKGGAVVSHIQIAAPGTEIFSARISIGSARLLIGCDAVVAAAPENLSRLSSRVGFIVASNHESITGQFTRESDFTLPMHALSERLVGAVEPGQVKLFDAIDLATSLVGDAVGANLLLLGCAWQQGLVPLSLPALEAAIELNGVAIGLNKAAFTWGRRAAVNIEEVRKAAAKSVGAIPEHHRLSQTVTETVVRQAAFLTDYQNAAYASRYRAVVQRVHEAEQAVVPGGTQLTDKVARTLFRLMAYKDEYEVARLHVTGGFMGRLKTQFEGSLRVTFHMAPPLLSRRDAVSGEPKKLAFGQWFVIVLQVLARMRWLRGTPFDPFGYLAERKTERRLIADYVECLNNDVLPFLSGQNHRLAVEWAEALAAAKGFGHVKAKKLAAAQQHASSLLRDYRAMGGVQASDKANAAFFKENSLNG